jgi:hypothetical protein
MDNSRLMIDQMMDDSKYFFVRGQKHAYLGEDDPVFQASEPVPRKPLQGGKCQCCRQVFKNVKSVGYCEFCGQGVCRGCLVKQRPFNVQIVNLDNVTNNSKDVRVRGTICQVCDRKHYIKDLLHSTLDTIETNVT